MVPSSDRPEGMTTHRPPDNARRRTLPEPTLIAAPLGRLFNFYAELAHFQKPLLPGTSIQKRNRCSRPAVLFSCAHSDWFRAKAPRCWPISPVENLNGADAQQELLSAAWERGEARDPAARFYARVLLQPYAEYLASRGDIPATNATGHLPVLQCTTRRRSAARRRRRR